MAVLYLGPAPYGIRNSDIMTECHFHCNRHCMFPFFIHHYEGIFKYPRHSNNLSICPFIWLIKRHLVWKFRCYTKTVLVLAIWILTCRADDSCLMSRGWCICVANLHIAVPDTLEVRVIVFIVINTWPLTATVTLTWAHLGNRQIRQ